MLKLKSGKFPSSSEFADRLQSIAKKSDKVVFGVGKPIYRLVSNHDGVMAALAVIGSMVAHNDDWEKYSFIDDKYKNVHVWRFVDSCERCDGGKSMFGIQFDDHLSLYYFVRLGFEMFTSDELVQKLTYSILKDLGY